MKVQKVNLNEKYNQFNDHWNPRIIAELNGQQVKLAKVQGEFVWHHHENEDELFYVVDGILTIEFRDHVVELGPGELIVVPKGVEHKPVAREEVKIMLFEPKETLNTGNIKGNFTKEDLGRI